MHKKDQYWSVRNSQFNRTGCYVKALMYWFELTTKTKLQVESVIDRLLLLGFVDSSFYVRSVWDVVSVFASLSCLKYNGVFFDRHSDIRTHDNIVKLHKPGVTTHFVFILAGEIAYDCMGRSTLQEYFAEGYGVEYAARIELRP